MASLGPGELDVLWHDTDAREEVLRRTVDERLAEHGYTAIGIVDDDTAPSLGNELGAQTLIVGRYRFNCEGELVGGEGTDFIQPTKVFSQSVQVKGFHLETAQVLFDVELTLDEASSEGRMLPRSLARGAGRRLVAKLKGEPTAFDELQAMEEAAAAPK